jgi:hypothetical protein
MKNCPFKNEVCSSECALFISSSELNEMVANRLRSIGVISANSDGLCSLKNMALAQSRFIFENTKVFNSQK